MSEVQEGTPAGFGNREVCHADSQPEVAAANKNAKRSQGMTSQNAPENYVFKGDLLFYVLFPSFIHCKIVQYALNVVKIAKIEVYSNNTKMHPV